MKTTGRDSHRRLSSRLCTPAGPSRPIDCHRSQVERAFFDDDDDDWEERSRSQLRLRIQLCLCIIIETTRTHVRCFCRVWCRAEASCVYREQPENRRPSCQPQIWRQIARLAVRLPDTILQIPATLCYHLVFSWCILTSVYTPMHLVSYSWKNSWH